MICRECEAPTARQTALCEDHYHEAMARVAQAFTRRKRAPAISTAVARTPAPRARDIHPADAFQPPAGGLVPAADRAEHLARWLVKVGEAVTRADAARVCGVDPTSGSARRAIAVGERRGWIKRGPSGAVLPGTVEPSE